MQLAQTQFRSPSRSLRRPATNATVAISSACVGVSTVCVCVYVCVYVCICACVCVCVCVCTVGNCCQQWRHGFWLDDRQNVKMELDANAKTIFKKYR